MTAQRAAHELLVALAGRLTDEMAWRLRDWLAAGAFGPLGELLPRELLRQRIALTDAERDLLVRSAGAWGASRRLLEAVLPVEWAPDPGAVFRAGPDGLDTAVLSVLGVVRGHPGCTELRQAWRDGTQRVIVVRGGERPWALTGTLQRVLRAHGDRTPCVEVLPAHGEPPSYHRAAIIGSGALWRNALEAVAVGG